MKKLLLATSLLGALSTSAIAKEHGMYVRVDGNAGWLVDGISADNMKGGQLVKDSTSNKPMAWWVQGGFGSYLIDSVRLELTAFYLMDKDFDVVNSTATPTSTYTALALTPATSPVTDLSSKITVGSYGLLVKGYFDIADFGGTKLFLGATGGYAWTTVNQVLTGMNAGSAAVAAAPNANPAVSAQAKVDPAAASVTTKSDKYGDLAYGFNVGVSYEISDSAELNVEYSYLHLAEVKDDGATIKNTYDMPYHVNAHNIGVGVRFYF